MMTLVIYSTTFTYKVPALVAGWLARRRRWGGAMGRCRNHASWLGVISTTRHQPAAGSSRKSQTGHDDVVAIPAASRSPTETPMPGTAARESDPIQLHGAQPDRTSILSSVPVLCSGRRRSLYAGPLIAGNVNLHCTCRVGRFGSPGSPRHQRAHGLLC